MNGIQHTLEISLSALTRFMENTGFSLLGSRGAAAQGHQPTQV